MRVVLSPPLPLDGRMLHAKLYYGPDDLVLKWELVYNGLNLSMMTFKQVEQLTGMTSADVNRAATAIQRWIDHQEGRV